LEYEKEIAIQLLFTGIIHRTSLSKSFFGFQMENASVEEISRKYIFPTATLTVALTIYRTNVIDATIFWLSLVRFDCYPHRQARNVL